MTANEEAFKNFVFEMEGDQERELRNALDSIEKAEDELRNVRTQLIEAAAGRPYLRVGQLRGVDAGPGVPGVRHHRAAGHPEEDSPKPLTSP